MHHIRPACVADFPVLMERILASFSDGSPTHPPFDIIYPDVIRRDAACMPEWLLVESDGEIAAGLQLVPRPLVIAGEIELKAAGLGQVFCYPPFRRRGYMSELLVAVNEKMAADGIAAGFLGGDRLRYGRYGWETAGNAREVGISGRLVPGLDSNGKWWQPRRWDGNVEDVPRMAAAYARLPYRAVRSAAEFARVMQRPGQAIWFADTDGEFAYVSLTGNSIAEYAGDAAALDRIIRYLAPRMGLHAYLPPDAAESALEQLLVRYAGRVSVTSADMVRVVSVARVLNSYQPMLERRLAGWSGAFSLAIADSAEAVALRGDGRRVRVELVTADAGRPAELTLDRRDLARLLFGPCFPPLPPGLAEHEVVRRVFPLPLYWPPLSRV